MQKFLATGISATSQDEGLQVTFLNAQGETCTVRLTPEVIVALAPTLGDLAKRASKVKGMPTKLPKTFAVGAGKYERVVLLRFEDDAPYGLCADDAARLGNACLGLA